MPPSDPTPTAPDAAPTPAPPAATAASNGHANGNGHHDPHKGPLAPLVLGALGIVFGDIGTSPLYAVRESFGPNANLTPTPEHVLGVLSIIFWSITLIVTLKYIVLVLRADNKGEGGVLALASLASQGIPRNARRWRRSVMVLAVIGLALFYGDSIVTPAVSVLSAVEGLEVIEPGLKPLVVPIALIILVGLFSFQSRGTARVGRLFGPVMVVWFFVLGVLGLWQIVKHPGVLAALSPHYALDLIQDRGLAMFLPLGAMVLAVTGAEAIYTDMGHFGRRPIRIAWLGVCMPGLILNYFGQGALIIADPEVASQVFFELVPKDGVIFLVLLSTAATVIASQAVISGVFSLTRQAIQLGYLPRMDVRHTSETEIGQIYIPRMNWLVMAGVVALVVGFGSSSKLVGAYGLAVTGAMLVDAALATIVAVLVWRWSWPAAVATFGLLAIPEACYFIANLLKIPAGGWLPLLVAVLVFYTVATWRRGRTIVVRELYDGSLPLKQFLDRMERAPDRVAGTAVFLTNDATSTPPAFLHNLKHNKVLHERIIILQVDTVDEPRVPAARRVEVERLGKGFYTVVARYGFMEQPDVPAALRACRPHGIAYDEMETSFFLGRETLVPASRSELGVWRQAWFISLSHTASATKIFFRIPPNRAIELGNQIQV